MVLCNSLNNTWHSSFGRSVAHGKLLRCGRQSDTDSPKQPYSFASVTTSFDSWVEVLSCVAHMAFAVPLCAITP